MSNFISSRLTDSNKNTGNISEQSSDFNSVEVYKFDSRSIARDLMSTIKDIENAIKGSSNSIEEIENRGWVDRLISSSSKDIVNISKSQNKINDFMLLLIQEIITLNVMSYSYLHAVFDDFKEMSKNGWKDSEGKFQELHEDGKIFADNATSIFEKILLGARSTQDKIEKNSYIINENRDLILSNKDKIQENRSLIGFNAERIANLQDLLREKESIDDQQSQEIERIKQEVFGNHRSELDSLMAAHEILKESHSNSLIEFQEFLKLIEAKHIHLQGEQEKNLSLTAAQSEVLSNRVKLLEDKIGALRIGVLASICLSVLLTGAVSYLAFLK